MFNLKFVVSSKTSVELKYWVEDYLLTFLRTSTLNFWYKSFDLNFYAFLVKISPKNIYTFFPALNFILYTKNWLNIFFIIIGTSYKVIYQY